MSKTIEYKIPVKDKKGVTTYETRHGIPALLYVGAYQERFALQFEGEDAEPTKLVHVATGYSLGKLNDAGIRLLVARGNLTTPRECAKYIIAQLVRDHTAATVLAKLKAIPVINP